ELGKYLDEEAVARVDAVRAESPRETMAGIFVQSEEQRVYPAGELAIPIVGGVDPDENGTFGIEYLYDEVMTGKAGSTTSEKGAGRYGTISVGDFEVDPASEGYDVVLTIDHRLQYVVEQALVQHCEETGGNWATAVGSDPRTGEILFMGTASKNEDGTCSVPNYNAALIKTFEPGSVMKAVTVAAAVDQLGINRNTTYDVPRSLQVGDVTFTQSHDFEPAPYPLMDILANSMNIGTMLMARDLGAESLYGYMKAFGIGEPTGIDFKGEATGTLRDWTEWYDSNMGSIPIGQGVTTNAVQILSAYNAIANDGLFVSPKLVSALVSPDGSEILTEPQTSDRAVSSETADEVTAMLEAVVDYGTGQAAAIPGYNVAGKTGTAWKVYDYGDGRSGYGEDGARRYTVTFAGFVLAENFSSRWWLSLTNRNRIRPLV
ncbi:MAG: penicillin-binding protein 2, partial [Acidimicrobiales bacterium]